VVLNKGDPVLIETPAYAGILPPLRNLEARPIGKSGLHRPSRANGQRSKWTAMAFRRNISKISSLPGRPTRSGLECYSEITSRSSRTSLTFSVNPTGCNPSGCSHSLERKLAVLKVCKKYELLIMEGEPRHTTMKISLMADDPYCTLIGMTL